MARRKASEPPRTELERLLRDEARIDNQEFARVAGFNKGMVGALSANLRKRARGDIANKILTGLARVLGREVAQPEIFDEELHLLPVRVLPIVPDEPEGLGARYIPFRPAGGEPAIPVTPRQALFVEIVEGLNGVFHESGYRLSITELAVKALDWLDAIDAASPDPVERRQRLKHKIKAQREFLRSRRRDILRGP